MNFRQMVHNLTHKHEVYAKGEATISICAARVPWGKCRILYQPNQYIDPFEINPDQLEKVFKGEAL